MKSRAKTALHGERVVYYNISLEKKKIEYNI